MPTDKADKAERQENIPSNPFGADVSTDNAAKNISDEASKRGSDQNAPPEISNLREKERNAELGRGPNLSKQEEAKLSAYTAFPKPEEKTYRDLHERNLLAQKGLGEPISREEQAKLNAKVAFPNDADTRARALHEKELLAEQNLGPKLSKDEKAVLYAALAFPNNPTGRILHEAELRADFGIGPPLSPQQQARLGSLRAFPNPKDEPFRALQERSNLYHRGLGPELTQEEQRKLTEALTRGLRR